MSVVRQREVELLIVVVCLWVASLGSAYVSLPQDTLFSLLALGLVPDIWLWSSIGTTFLVGLFVVLNTSYSMRPSHMNRVAVAIIGLVLTVVLFVFPFMFVYVMLLSVASVGGMIGSYINWYRDVGETAET